MSIERCTDCPPTTVDLKLSVSAPNTIPVSALPSADFVVVVWTEAEAGALATVFGNGAYSFETDSNNNFTPLLYPGMKAPSGERYHAFFFQATVNGKTVVCLKSEFHPKVQTAATTVFFEKVIGPAAGRNVGCLITSGTSGGIWSSLDVGDVVVTNTARYGLTMPVEKQALLFTGQTDILGSSPPAEYANWFDYATGTILATDACVSENLQTEGGRDPASGLSKIYYAPSGGSPTDVVTNSRITDDECGRIATYRTLGGTLDENDAYVAEACEAVAFSNWVSIRNVSDLPCSTNDNQYDEYGFCSSINGAYAVWAFIIS